MFLLRFQTGNDIYKDLFSSVAGLYEDSLFIGDTFEFLNLKENITAAEPMIVPHPLKKKLWSTIFPSRIRGNNFKTNQQCVHLRIKKEEE